MNCPCGSEIEFDQCCGAIHKNHRLADTAEKLMRARYSAFVVKDEGFLLRSWNKSRRPLKLYLKNQELEWLGLSIHDTVNGGSEDNAGEVEFSARYQEEGKTYTLKERSRFRKKGNLWYYLDGAVEVTEKE